MKNTSIYLLLVILLSSCSLSIHSVKKGKIDIPSKESYQVPYEVKFNSELLSRVGYTNELGNLESTKEYSKLE